MKNFIPGRYRGVSISHVEIPLEEAALREHFLGKDAYRTTEYIVARRGDEAALLRVTKRPGDEVFEPIESVEMLCGPQDCAYVLAPEVDTGIPTDMARAAREMAQEKRCAVVQGLYEHVNFVLDPAPIPVRVVDVGPPYPAKLVDQVRRVLATAEHLAPVEVVPDITDLVELAKGVPADHYLYPCLGSGAAPEGADVSYLDQRPAEPEEAWTLVGCARSRQIYSWIYGKLPANVDFCPRKLAALNPSEGATLTKCCLLDEGMEREGSTVTVPWGSSLAEVYDGLEAAVKAVEPAWHPA